MTSDVVPGLPMAWREVEIRLACTATKFPPTPLMIGEYIAIPFHLLTALDRTKPPPLCMCVRERGGGGGREVVDEHITLLHLT